MQSPSFKPTPFAADRAPPPSVTAELAYCAPGDERPYDWMYEPGKGEPRDNYRPDRRGVRITDARHLEQAPTLSSEGFELCVAPSVVTDFRDSSAVREIYYAEALELVLTVTGARRGYVFDHLVRQREAGRPPLSTFGRVQGARGVGAAGRVHNDYSEASGRRRLELVLDDPASRAGLRRYAIVNLWRPTRGPVLDTPLALCDARSVAAADLVTSEVRYADRTGEIYLLRHSPWHRWYYYSKMDRHEVLVFKQYDSQISGVSRFTPHAAFDDPGMPADAPLRESIEVRCLVVFDGDGD